MPQRPPAAAQDREAGVHHEDVVVMGGAAGLDALVETFLENMQPVKVQRPSASVCL